MLKIFFAFIVIVHGLIHLMGFVKAFNFAEMSQLTQPISKVSGIIWLLTTLLFLATLVLFFTKFDYWWLIGVVALVLSQILIIQNWDDAKFGTVANILILIPVFIASLNVLPTSFQNMYKAAVQERIRPISDNSIVSENDIAHLPAPVQNYLRYTGVIGKPRVYNFWAINSGNMKQSPKSDWITVKAQQYDFFDEPARLFYIQSDLFGVPFDGLHAYTGNSATMQIKVASLLQVADAKGAKMNQSENVTIFNEMCMFAPATLIDKNIKWEALDSLTAKAWFTHNNITISATLYFNEKGELIDFSSDDRFLSLDGKDYASYRWSTPVKDYRDFEGRKVPVYGDAIWHMPEGDYTYAKYQLENIVFNSKEFTLLAN